MSVTLPSAGGRRVDPARRACPTSARASARRRRTTRRWNAPTRQGSTYLRTAINAQSPSGDAAISNVTFFRRPRFCRFQQADRRSPERPACQLASERFNSGNVPLQIGFHCSQEAQGVVVAMANHEERWTHGGADVSPIATSNVRHRLQCRSHRSGLQPMAFLRSILSLQARDLRESAPGAMAAIQKAFDQAGMDCI